MALWAAALMRTAQWITSDDTPSRLTLLCQKWLQVLHMDYLLPLPITSTRQALLSFPLLKVIVTAAERVLPKFSSKPISSRAKTRPRGKSHPLWVTVLP
jgi:hypothetical protein